jgi:hypothetical protein
VAVGVGVRKLVVIGIVAGFRGAAQRSVSLRKMAKGIIGIGGCGRGSIPSIGHWLRHGGLLAQRVIGVKRDAAEGIRSAGAVAVGVIGELRGACGIGRDVIADGSGLRDA